VFLLGLVSCGEEKKKTDVSNYSETNLYNSKKEKSFNWSQEDKDKCLKEMKIQFNNSHDLNEIFNLSNEKFAECICSSAEKKSVSFENFLKSKTDAKKT